MDAKDILGLTETSLPIPQEKKSRPPKDSQRKPSAMSREITWEWLSFMNSARKDNLQPYHWVRVANGTPLTGDYSFAKYNKSIDVIKYTEEEYEKHLTDPAWTKEETDQLFDLGERFNLCFVVIADRFPSSRSVEELKNRYYSVSRAILIARAPSPADVSSHPLVKEPYNITYETERKHALSMVLSQTKHQERKDAEILSEAKKITESRAAKAAHDAELAVTSNTSPERIEKTTAPVETVSPSDMQLTSGGAPLLSMAYAAAAAAAAASLRELQVYARTYALDQMVQAASSSAGLRTIKRVEQFLQELKVSLKPKVPTKAVCAEHLELRKEILTLLNLQKLLHNKEEGSSSPAQSNKRSRKLKATDR